MTRSVPEADDSGAQLGKGQQEMRVEGGPQSITSQISIRVGGAKREASSWSLGRKVCGLVGLLGPDRRDSAEGGWSGYVRRRGYFRC